jgi:hypothetical protein
MDPPLAVREAEPTFSRVRPGIDDVSPNVSKTGTHRWLSRAETALAPPNEKVCLFPMLLAAKFKDATDHAEARKILKVNECAIDRAPG